MRITRPASALLALSLGLLFGSSTAAPAQQPPFRIPLKEAKLNIEHNATDEDTGFQGFIDAEGWRRLTVTGPNGAVLELQGLGKLGRLGLTELFFETVEPENAKVPLRQILSTLPEGRYEVKGPAVISRRPDARVQTFGTAWLTHDIPQGPELLAPARGATVPAGDLIFDWQPVTKTIKGGPVEIVAYQLIVEQDVPPHPHMIGKLGLSMYVPATTTSMRVPREFLKPGATYEWEVLAIEKSGNQTLSSSVFRTR